MMSPARIAVIPSAAGFQSLTFPLRSSSGLLLRSAPDFAARLGACDRHPLQRRALFGEVDKAPVGEASNDQLADPLDRRLVVERRGELRYLAEEVEPGLPFSSLGNRGSLGGNEPVALVLDPFPLADVHEE